METKVKNKQKKNRMSKFGPVEKASEPITFKYGIPGFEHLSKFIFQDLVNYPPFQIFRSLEEDDLSMIVLNAKYLKDLEGLKIPNNELQQINADSQKDIDMYVILRVKAENKQFVANTRAPLIVNKSNNLGNQIVIEKEGLLTDYPIQVAGQSDE